MSTKHNTKQIEFLPFKSPWTSRILKVTGCFEEDKDPPAKRVRKGARKAEHLEKGADTRFLVMYLKSE